MKKTKTYNIFLFLSTFTRTLIEVFSLVLLYKKGYTLNNILLFLMLTYLIGIPTNYLSLKIYYKTTLIISTIIYGISYIYLSLMNNTIPSLIILAILLSIGNYSYHTIRHYLALTMLENKNRNPRNLILITYIAIIISSIIGSLILKLFPLITTSIIIFILSFISIFPILKQKKIIISKEKINNKVIIPKEKIIFNILEQFKVIFLTLQPLFLYIYIDKSIYYVGIFNIITNISSLIVVYFLSKRLNKNHFKYYSLILGIIFIFKINIKSGLFLLILAFFEGIFIKIYENISLENLYNYHDNDIKKYLQKEELIFFITKSIILFVFLIFRMDFYTIMYINIISVILSGFFIKKRSN